MTTTKPISAFGITVTTLEQAVRLISSNPDPICRHVQPLYEYGAVVGYEEVMLPSPNQERAKKRVAGKRWLRANGFIDLIDTTA